MVVGREERIVSGNSDWREPETTSEARPGDVGRILCVALGAVETEIADALGSGFALDVAPDVAAARVALAARTHDVLLVGMAGSERRTLAFVEEIRDAAWPCAVIAVAEDPDVESVIAALRHGVVDVLRLPVTGRELRRRVGKASRIARRLRRTERRLEQLERAHDAAQKAAAASGSGWPSSSLAGAYHALVHEELDIEHLLRRTLEFILERTGPTNAAVFLPTAAAEYSLGAYVNYDVPRETAGLMLDDLADVVGPAFEHEAEVVVLPDASVLRERLGEQAAWLEGSGAVVFASHGDEGCLAVVLLFRDRDVPFDTLPTTDLAALRDLLGRQLGRVVRVHNRMLEDTGWEGFEIDDDADGWDCAA